jgi:hypothetical protein
MKKVLAFCFNQWWWPMLLWAITFACYFVFLGDSDDMTRLCFYLSIVTLIVLVGSAYYQFSQNKMTVGVITIVLSLINLLFIFFYALVRGFWLY